MVEGGVVNESGNGEAVAEKLGINGESIVAMSGLIGVDDDGSIQRAISARAKHAKDGTIEPESNVILMRVGHVLELSALKRLKNSMRPDAVVWVLWQKDKPNLSESDVRKGAQDAGMVDGESFSFTERFSALKLTVPQSAG